MVVRLASPNDLRADRRRPAFRQEPSSDSSQEVRPAHSVVAIIVIRVPVANDLVRDAAASSKDHLAVLDLLLSEVLVASQLPLVESGRRDLAVAENRRALTGRLDLSFGV